MKDVLHTHIPHNRYRKRLDLARKRGMAAPPLPEGVDDAIVQLYDEVMAHLTEKVRVVCLCMRARANLSSALLAFSMLCDKPVRLMPPSYRLSCPLFH